MRTTILAIVALLALSGNAEAWRKDLPISPEEYARMTQESPPPSGCHYVPAQDLWECTPGKRQPVGDYLPAVVPEAEQNVRQAPQVTTLVQGIQLSCRRVGKASELCGADNTSATESAAAAAALLN